MPIVPAQQFSDAYKQIKRGSAAGNCTVLIFVARDCDSLCASRILTVRYPSPLPPPCTTAARNAAARASNGLDPNTQRTAARVGVPEGVDATWRRG